MKPRHVIAVCLLVAGAQSTLFGQFAEDALRFSQSSLGVGARALALGGASVARSADYSSLFSNPAALTTMRDFEVSLGFSRNSVTNSALYLGSTSQSDNSSTLLENAGIVYPVPTSRGSLTFAFGFARLVDFTSVVSYAGFNGGSSLAESLTPYTDLWAVSIEEEEQILDASIPFRIWLADTSNGYLYSVVTDSVQQRGTVLEGGGVNHWSFGGGIEIARNISAGVSLNILSGKYSYDREFTETDDRNVYSSAYSFPYNFKSFSYVSTIESQLTGFNMLLGLTMRIPGKYQAGISLRTPTTFEISEVFSDEGRSSFDDGYSDTYAVSNRTDYRVVTPYVFGGGVSVQVFDWLSVSGDAEYTDWTQVAFDTDHPDLLQENRYIKKAFRETTNLRGGAEVTLWDLGVALRAGMAYLPSPYEGDPSNFDQKYLTGGIGVALDRQTTLNVSGVYGRWNSFRDNYYIDNLVRPSTTSESLTSMKVFVTLSYRF